MLSRSSVLHYWSSRYGPLPVIGGKPTHSRNSSGKVADARGEFYDVIVNTPRFSWETDKSTSANERRATMLLEMARTNSCQSPRDLSNAAWTTVSGTGTTTFDRVGLDGAANSATAVFDTDASAFYSRRQTVTVVNNSAAHVVRFWIAKTNAALANYPGLDLQLTGGATPKQQQYHLDKFTGAIVSSLAAGGGGVGRVIDDGLFWLVEISLANNTTGNTTLAWQVYPSAGSVFGTNAAATTGGCIVGLVQVELNAGGGSSPIVTGGATRAADSFYWAFPPAPQGMMIHSRHVERGGALAGGGLWAIGNPSAIAFPWLLLYGPGAGGYRLSHNPAGVAYTADSPAVAVGDTVDIAAVLTPAGSVRVLQSINGAAVSDTGVIAGAAIAGAWNDTKLQLGQYDIAHAGLNAHAELKVLKYADVVAATAQGIMDELRAFELGPNGDTL